MRLRPLRRAPRRPLPPPRRAATATGSRAGAGVAARGARGAAGGAAASGARRTNLRYLPSRCAGGSASRTVDGLLHVLPVHVQASRSHWVVLCTLCTLPGTQQRLHSSLLALCVQWQHVLPGGRAARPGRAARAAIRGRSSCKALHRLPSSMLAAPLRQAAEVDARMLGALLAGVRRALPYVGEGDAGDVAVGRHADALFRMLHVAPFGVRVQALALLQQLLADREAMSDRFYRRAFLPGARPACVPCSITAALLAVSCWHCN